MKNASPSLFLAFTLFPFSACAAEAPTAGPAAAPPAAKRPPNIVVILADDLGYGDVHCLNPEHGKIATPCLDRLANQGMSFTEAHTSSSVCTPTRYGLLTGRYNWRSKLQSGVLKPYDPPLIDQDRLTLPGFLKQQGYATACIGKWHLGWDWPKKDGKPDFTQPIAGGPTTRGFDSYFGTDVPNYPPYCFIANDRTVGIPRDPLPAESLRGPLASYPGPAVPAWKLEDILPRITAEACAYVEKHAKEPKPYFLYLPLTAPHTPIAVAPEWRGKSGINDYADFVMETDAMIGRVLAAIDASGSADDTLVFLTSDNGFSPKHTGLDQLLAKGHLPSADRRGYKSDIFDGGLHVPLFVRWPGKIAAGSSSPAPVSLVDLMATCAEVVHATYPDTAGEDSVGFLPLLLDREAKPRRDTLVLHSINGSFALRRGRWKLELCAGSGGWSDPTKAAAKDLPSVQLYDMAQDVSERRNVQAEHPEIVADLTAALEKIVADGRSTPGSPRKNDAKIRLMK